MFTITLFVTNTFLLHETFILIYIFLYRLLFLFIGADEKEQYKAYGKTFRKMIVDCLQKDPSKRPTATELLKHPFFKKAKDRKYLTQTLVAIGPSMETRVHKVLLLKHYLKGVRQTITKHYEGGWGLNKISVLIFFVEHWIFKSLNMVDLSHFLTP